MHIASIQIENYKSFRSSPVIELLPGINVIVGENNTGKTSLLVKLLLELMSRGVKTRLEISDTVAEYIASGVGQAISDSARAHHAWNGISGDTRVLLVDDSNYKWVIATYLRTPPAPCVVIRFDPCQLNETQMT